MNAKKHTYTAKHFVRTVSDILMSDGVEFRYARVDGEHTITFKGTEEYIQNLRRRAHLAYGAPKDLPFEKH